MPAPASPFDPLARMEPGEDRFVIRENDPDGPAVIAFWAHQRRNRTVKRYGADPELSGDARRLRDADIAQCAEAEEKALTWSERQHGGEAATEERASYAGAALSEEQVAAAKRQKHEVEAIRNLREAAYHLKEMLDVDGPAATAEVIEAHQSTNANADALQYGARVAA
jgi:hypothetical protein